MGAATVEEVEEFRNSSVRKHAAHSAAGSNDKIYSYQTIDLKLIAHSRGLHPLTNRINPFHWVLFAKTGPGDLGITYQLRGMPGSFNYPGPERRTNPASIELSSHDVEIGRVPIDALSTMERDIQDVPVSKAEYGFNCQNWTEDVLHSMAARK